MIKYGCQKISNEDIQAVVNVMRSEYLTQGPVVHEFENSLANLCDSTHALAVNSATSALHLSYLALGLDSGDVLWTSPNTFVATANAALMCGATVDFVDIDKTTYNISVKILEQKLVTAAKNGKLPKIIVPVHFAGTPCDMKRIYELSKTYGFRIVEDASHAVGATYEQEKTHGECYPVGCGKYSDLSVFSLHPVKIITSGEGGILTCNDQDLFEKLQLLRSHGVSRDEKHFELSNPGPWDYEQVVLGYNYRMTELQAALGLSQLSKLKEFIKQRMDLVKHYEIHLKNINQISLPLQPATGQSSNHLFCILLNEKLIKYKKEIFQQLTALGIGVNVHYRPVPEQYYYKKMGIHEGSYSNALEYYKQALSLPLHPSMSEQDVEFICESLENIISCFD